MPLLCCEVRLTLDSSEFDGKLYPPRACEVAHGRNAKELVADFGERLKALAMCPTRIERADEDPDELGQIESDYNGLIELIHLATDHALQEDKTHIRHDLDLELDDEVWDVECKVYVVPTIRYIARFDAQAWIRDEAVSVDPQGETEWDCTSYMLTQPYWLGDRDPDLQSRLSEGEEILDNDDVFMGDEDAPEWIRNWQGPFSIWIRRESYLDA